MASGSVRVTAQHPSSPAFLEPVHAGVVDRRVSDIPEIGSGLRRRADVVSRAAGNVYRPLRGSGKRSPHTPAELRCALRDPLKLIRLIDALRIVLPAIREPDRQAASRPAVS